MVVNQIANLDLKFKTSTTLNFAWFLTHVPSRVEDLRSWRSHVNLIDSTSCQLIKTLQVNGFRKRLQIKLISEMHLELMFQGTDLTMHAKSLLNYNIQVLCDNPLFKLERSTKHKNLHQAEQQLLRIWYRQKELANSSKH